MLITEKLKKELQEILRTDFGMNISENDAFEIGQDLINYFEILIEENYEQNHKKD